MWYQILCFLLLSLPANLIAEYVVTREPIPCDCLKVPPKTHDSYYENDVYRLPSRYKYGDHHHGYVQYGLKDQSKNVGYNRYKQINPLVQQSPLHHQDSVAYSPKPYLGRYVRDLRQQEQNYYNALYTSINSKNADDPYQIQQDNGLANQKSYNDGYQNQDDHNIFNTQYDDVYKQYRNNGYDQNEKLQGKHWHHAHRPQTYLPTYYYRGERQPKPKPIYKYLLPGIFRNLQDFQQQLNNSVSDNKNSTKK